jgi:hypothetical protein
MNVTLIRIDAQDASGTAVPVRIASHDIPEACHLGGEEWEPALATLPDFALDFFGGAFAGQVTAPRTGFTVTARGLAGFTGSPATRPRFADARVRIWTGDITSPATVDLGPLTLRFDGRITGEPDVDEAARIARFDAAVQDSWADKPLLALFAGTGGIEGPADLTGQVEPLVLGNARFCGGTLIDNVDNIWMVSNGPVQAVNAVYDRLASLGASAGNFANLAALKAASIPNGGWGTCLALGLVRLGAPPDGRVSFDVSGSNSGTGGYVRRPGAMIRRIADLAGGTVNASSLTALDTARPYNLALQLREQVSARDVIAQIADSVGAVAGVSLRGELFAQALAIGTPSDTLAPDDTSAMRVLPVEELAKAAPSWRLATEAELTFEVHSADEAAFNYRWQGEYAAARVYRRDDVVTGPDGAAWAYINAAPAAGQTLPVWPVTSNAHWRLFQAPAGASVAPANSNRVPLSRMEGDSGWVLQFNGAGLSAPTDYGTFEGMRFFRVKATATAAGQTISIGGLPSGLPHFRLIPGERISFQTRVELAGAGAGNWFLALWGFRADGSQYAIPAEAGSVASGSAPRFIANDPVRFFVTVPSDVVSARIEVYGVSGAAGLMDLVISEPMVTSAAPGQTVHPPFTPGPVLTGPIDAGGPLLIGQLPTDKAAPGLQNALVPLGNANRVPFSRFEGGQGWNRFVDGSTGGAPGLLTFDGRPFINADPVFSAANQNHYIFNDPPFAVTPNERLSVSAGIDAFSLAGPQPQFWQFYIDFLNSSGANVGGATIASGNGASPSAISNRLSGFVTVPANAVRAVINIRVQSAGAGTIRMAFLEPIVTSASPVQTVHPPYTPGPNAVDGATRNTGALNADGLEAVDAGGPLLIGQLPTGKADPNLRNVNVVLAGTLAARPASGSYLGQTYAATDTREFFRWDGFIWQPTADVTVVQQRSILAQFPVIEIKQGEAGNVGTRTVTHKAYRAGGTIELTGGTWSLVAEDLGSGDATVNASTGTVSLSGIGQSGKYVLLYVHTDGLANLEEFNVTFVPSPIAAAASARTGRATSTNGTDNDNNWQTILSLTVSNVPSGRVTFGSLDLLTGVSRLSVTSATGTADYEARLTMDGSTLTSVLSQNVVSGGALQFTEWTQLFAGSYPVTSGNRTFAIQMRRTSGTGRILATNTALEPTIIAT